MNIAKKDYPFWILIAAGVCVVVFLITSKGDRGGDKALTSASPTPAGQAQQTPGIIVTETNVSNYRDLLVQFDGFRIELDAECKSAQPSNVTFKNMTQIMLDNSKSAKPRTVTIGDRTYNLVAHGWYLTTLYTPKKLPVNLKMSCGDMELGQIGLE